MSEIPAYTLAYYGCNHEGYDGGGHDSHIGTNWIDIWGTGWEKELADIMAFPKYNPLADISSLREYEWPNPNDENIYGYIYKSRDEFTEDDCFITGFHRDTLWEKAYMLVGMENMLVNLLTEPEFAKEILHKIMDFQLGIAKHYVKCGVELVLLGDDLGTQKSLIIGEELLYEFFVPEYRRLINYYKEQGIIISFHSCGHIEPLLDMFIELGINVLNPIQATANNLAYVREKTDNKMALLGGVSTKLVMDGSIEEIEIAVKDAIYLLGKNGGYFCAPDQSMPFPKEKITAFHKAVDYYGKM